MEQDMRYDTDHKERMHRQILAEAAIAIRAKGPDRVGVAEVMSRLGLTHGGFYAHFESKDDLIAQAITYMFDETFARFLRKTEGVEPQKGLADFIDYYLSTIHRDARSRGCALAALSGDLPRLTEVARARFTEGVERLSGAIGKLLKKLNVENVEVMALSAVSEIVGALALSRAVADPKLSEQILRASRGAVKARLGLGKTK
jgi:TetR/AcrR family transcriptional repressor of nem operon